MSDNIVEELTNYENFIIKGDTSPIYNLVFTKGSEKIGTLCWDTGELIFTGNADEAAKIFFDYLKSYVDIYIKENIMEYHSGNNKPR